MTQTMGLETRTGETVALQSVAVAARIHTLLAETTVVQRYRNDTGANLEVAYTFPLPVDGVLLDFEVVLNGRTYRGQVMPSREAEARYEATLEQGDAAFRLQKVRDGIYTATLGNLMAGESAEIRLRYGEALKWQAGRLRYRLPTVIAPRYGEPAGMQPWQKPVTTLSADYDFTLRVTVLGELAQAGLASPSHKVAFQVTPEGAHLSLQGAAWLDRDFVLEIETGARASLGAMAEALDTRVALLNLMPPAVPVERAPGRDYVVVLDCSGSMAGDSIGHAKTGVGLALDSLRPQDRFAVIGFGTRWRAFDPALQPANRKNLNLAREFVMKLPDLGGTEMAAALDAALDFGQGGAVDILLLTDGECWDLTEVIQRANEAGSRIFTVGIGSAVAEDTVRALSDHTGGACELVTPNEDMAPRIAAHFGRMRQPRISGVEFLWPIPPEWTVTSREAHFAGDSSLTWAAFNEAVGEVKAALHQKQEQEPVQHTVALAPCPALAEALVRLGAAARLTTLKGRTRVEWAVRYQLVTDETDYLVTVTRAEADKAPDLPGLQVVPQMLPAGWGGTSTVMRSLSRANHAYPQPSSPFSIGEAPAQYDMPTSVRQCSRRNPAIEDAFQAKTFWKHFKTALEQRARRLPPNVPDTLQELLDLGLPEAVADALRPVIQRHGNEAGVVRALLVQIQTRAHFKLGVATRAVLTLAGPRDAKLEADIGQALDALPEEIWSTPPHLAQLDIDPLEIPDFLKRQAN